MIKILKAIFIGLILIIGHQSVFGQNDSSALEKKIPIVNGRAINLPIPDYPKEAEDFCADGKVEVEILINKNGETTKAEAISGNELLFDAAVKAARKAKFQQYTDIAPIETKGIIVYNFVPKRKCISVGIVNMRAINLPKPQIANLNHPRHFQIKIEEIVVVQIIVDISGNVTNANTILGHPLLRQGCEFAARQTKFSPTLVDGGLPFKVNALLAYKFKSDGTIDTQIERNDKDIIRTPINLLKPPSITCDCRFGANSNVMVIAEIDEKGKVVKAEGVSGHPLLKMASRKAALESKFLPLNVRIKMVIRYNFARTDKWAAEFSSVEIINAEIIK